jgi:TRAP-type uncharacterized transport system substrate-binding protein
MSDKKSWGKPAVDPMNLRSMLMLDVAREMMINDTWTHKAVSVTMSNPEHPDGTSVSFLGVNDPQAILDVAEGRLEVSTLNPVVMLNMARLGTGPFEKPLNVAVIAVMPHYDQLAFAVTDRLGFTSLADIAAARYPLRVSVRGSLDDVTAMSIDVVLSTYGFSLADIVAWGGSVFYDQPMPNHPTRLGRLENGEIDAIFEEGTIIWANDVTAAGASILPIDDAHLATLTALGFRRGVLDVDTYPTLPADIQTLDYSGWPIYCRADASDEIVRQFCAALEQAKNRIVWQIGPANQAPLPLDRMTTDSSATPFDVPLHPAAKAYWQELGYPVAP